MPQTYGVAQDKLFYEPAEKSLPRENSWSTEKYLACVPKLFEALRLKHGDDLHLLHDVHHRLTPIEAARLGKALEPYHLHDNPKMRYLMTDFRQDEKQFFRRTGAYTVNHLFALREETATEYPAAVKNLFITLKEANSLANRYRDEKQKAEAAWEREVMGEEFSYSLKQGCARRSLETLMEYQVQQGILDRKPDMEELFFPETLDV